MMFLLYIDPGTGSMLISAVIALFSVGFFMLRGFFYRKFSLGGSKGAKLDPSKHYGLVFYSEGKQYWNVFKPLLEECNQRSIPATYFSSDEDDLGLNANLEHIEAHFIGTGREAYYFLNRLSAEMVVMTTPGLDVLEIKRSKDVKHYCHVTHATGSVAGYKSYATDYYDSVLIGGDADREIIRELESKRNINNKEIKIIGHTYLDVFREKIANEKYEYTIFEQRRPTVLVSPTWGNHGLLTKYGEILLSTLEKSDLYNVIIRPHPQSFISEEKLMEKLMNDFPNGEHRVWDREVDALKSMAHADIMISDFSGIIFDFLFLFEKPILTMYGHYEKRGRDAMDLDEDPWDLRILDKIGQTIDETDIKLLPEIINQTLNQSRSISEGIAQAKNDTDKYPGESGVRGADFISTQLKLLKEEEKDIVQAEETDNSFAVTDLSWNNQKDVSFAGNIKNIFKVLTHPNTLFQMVMALVLFNGYVFLGKTFLPKDGLNQLFLENLFPYATVFSLLLFVLFIGLTWWKGRGAISFQKKHESLEPRDLLLLALPMTPIMQYIIANQDILSFSDSTIVFVFFSIISSVLVILIPWVLSTVVSRSLTIPISLGLLFVVLNMADFGRLTRQRYIVMILAIICIVIFLLLFFKKKNLIIIAIVIFFTTNIGVSIVDARNSEMSDYNKIDFSTSYEESQLFGHINSLVPVRTPDIFLLIYESYNNQETMDHYGFDNSDQVEYLLNQGFAIYDGAYSLGGASAISISHVLHLDLIPGAIEEYRGSIAGGAAGLGLLNELGYVTHLVMPNDYMTRGFERQYDLSLPGDMYSIDSYKIIINAVLEGEFRFDAELSTFNYKSYVEMKQMVLSQKLKKPEFMYTHSNYPGHTQNSGVLSPSDTEKHFKGIIKANEEMRQDIESLELENRDTIVIIAGDHGPYLTKNGTGLWDYDISEVNRIDIQDRYGTFLAIHWPESEYADKYDIQILQDVLPAAFSYIYKDDSLFDKTRMERETLGPNRVGGAIVRDGLVCGGIDDGKPLFDNRGVRTNGK